MNSRVIIRVVIVGFYLGIVTSCTGTGSDFGTVDSTTQAPERELDGYPEFTSTYDIQTQATNSKTPSPTPSATLDKVGPYFEEGRNPLTGEWIQDSNTLLEGPVLVSVTNFPPSARPQAGLSAAAHVWEISIGQGMTRFLAVYYGDYKQELMALHQSRIDQGETYVIGPVRSGRVPYEDIKLLYPQGKLFIRYASPDVLAELTAWENVFAQDPDNVNSAGIFIDDLDELTDQTVNPGDLSGLEFDSSPQTSGISLHDFRLVYNYYNHVGWRYDTDEGVYLRSQDRSDGEAVLSPTLDRLSGEELGFENVLVLFARHHFENVVGTILEIDLLYLPQAVGYLFSDGTMNEIRWSTRGANLELRDLEGNVIPLKHGKTFFEMLSYESTWNMEERIFRFHSPPLPTLTPSRTPTITPSSTPTPTTTGTPTPP